jgi:hypothetical protein
MAVINRELKLQGMIPSRCVCVERDSEVTERDDPEQLLVWWVRANVGVVAWEKKKSLKSVGHTLFVWCAISTTYHLPLHRRRTPRIIQGVAEKHFGSSKYFPSENVAWSISIWWVFWIVHVMSNVLIFVKMPTSESIAEFYTLRLLDDQQNLLWIIRSTSFHDFQENVPWTISM